VPESTAWKENRVEDTRQVLKTVVRDWKLFAYLVVLITFMTFFSHGTQDLYPDFLKQVHKVSDSLRANIVIVANLGAIVGAVIFGHLSQVAGRRKGMLAALLLALCVIPLWAYGSGLPMLVLGAFLMQAGVQGAWGVIPVHLNEVSAAAARGLMPGLAYQLGVLIASPTNSILYALYEHFGYQKALAGFEVCTIMGLSLLLWRGAEAHNKDFQHA
jgi:SHS family lactate transporter-like MFS transporter